MPKKNYKTNQKKINIPLFLQSPKGSTPPHSYSFSANLCFPENTLSLTELLVYTGWPITLGHFIYNGQEFNTKKIEAGSGGAIFLLTPKHSMSHENTRPICLKLSHLMYQWFGNEAFKFSLSSYEIGRASCRERV